MVEKKKETVAREPKDLRYRRQFFPNAEELVFDTAQKGFVPLSILLRKLLRHLTPPELRVFVYLCLRASRYGICYPTLEEMAYELGLSGRKNVSPHLKSLEEKHLISTRTAGGKKYFLVHHPRVATEHLAGQGKLREGELYEINELCDDLHQPPISTPKRSGRGSGSDD